MQTLKIFLDFFVDAFNMPSRFWAGFSQYVDIMILKVDFSRVFFDTSYYDRYVAYL